jgi:hypothetical protein
LSPPDTASQGAAAPLLPAPAGRYQLGEEIGRGGMGAVLRARDPRLNRELAVKVLPGDGQDRPELVRRFVEEAQVCSQLQHPGIVPVHDLGRLEDGRPFIAMKLVRGRTLAEMLRESLFVFPPWLAVGVPLFVRALTMLAAVYPARRAARVNPITALRQEGAASNPAARFGSVTPGGRDIGRRRGPDSASAAGASPFGQASPSFTDPAQNRSSNPRSIPWAQKLVFSSRGSDRGGPLTGCAAGGSRFGFTAGSGSRRPRRGGSRSRSKGWRGAARRPRPGRSRRRSPKRCR